MADVNISKFRAQVVREGSTPASPGFVVSDGQNPVDPSGSGQNHLPVTIATAATGLSITESQVLGGAGTVGQYIRGDGSLADFPATTGGGSSVSYYLNGSVSQGTIGGVAYKELNRTPIFGAGTDITINADGYIASFITDALDPNKLLIPAGNWNFETYFSASSSGGSPSFYVELYKYNGTTFTLIATSSAAPELIAFGTNLNPYFSTLAVPETVLALTDRLALRYYVTHSGRTITLHTENGHLCEVITTFTTGLTALNGLTNQVQFFAVGSAGTDFAISSASDTHTFNLPTASATNRGALSSADWTTFNGKTSNLGTVTSVGLSSATSGVTIGSSPVTTSGTITLAIATASGSQNGLLSSTDWTTFNGKQNALTNPVTGTGTSGRVAYWNGTNSITSDGDLLFDGSNVTVGGNIILTNGVNRFVRIGSASNYNYDLQTTGDNFQIIEAGGTPRLTFTYPTGAATFSSSVTAGGKITSTVSNNAVSIENTSITTGWNAILRAVSTGGNFQLGLEGSTAGNRFVGSLAYATYISTYTSTALQFATDNNARLTITSGGNVGIGTVPEVKFQVNDGTNINLGIKVGQTDTSAVMLNAFNDGAIANIPLEFRASKFGFQLGNVLIGTTTDIGVKLYVKGSAATNLFLESTGASVYQQFSNSGGNAYIGSISNDLVFLTTGAGTERMRITSVGFTKARANGGAYFGGNYHEFINNNNVSGGNCLVIGNAAGSNTNNTSSTHLIVADNAGDRLYIYGNGNVVNTNGSYGTISDIKFKENIIDANPKLEDILKLKVRNFNIIGEEQKQIGFIAQEFEEVFPSMVDISLDRITKEEYKSIKTTVLIPMLVKAIQEQQEIINNLKQRIS